MPFAKLEGLIVLAENITLGTFAGFAVSLDAGQYFWSSTSPYSSAVAFTAHLKAKLDAATGRTWTVSIDDNTDAATGRLTLSCSGAATTATWSSTALRDLLGFAADLSSATSWTSPGHVKHLWLPDCGRANAPAPDTSDGLIETIFTNAVAPGGQQYPIGGASRYVDTFEWPMLTCRKVFPTYETYLYESLQQFYLDVIRNGRPVRYYADRSNDAVHRTLVFDGAAFKPRPWDARWVHSAKALFSVGFDARRLEV